jgi:hypothetical protein
MAFLFLTKKAAAILGRNVQQAATQDNVSSKYEDWIIDTIWPQEKKNPSVLFYHRATGFVIALNPVDYSLEYCLTLVLQMLERLLTEHGLEKKLPYLQELFHRGYLCRNNDQRAVGYMTQSKMLINRWLDKDNNARVANSYDLMEKVNDNYRYINGAYLNTHLQDFLSFVAEIDEQLGITYLEQEVSHKKLH